MNKPTASTTCIAALLAIALTGCAASSSPSPKYDARFGDAVRQARLRMTINPDAGRNTDQVLGIDGTAAHESLVRYHESFKSPPPPVNVINIGGSIGAGGSQ